MTELTSISYAAFSFLGLAERASIKLPNIPSSNGATDERVEGGGRKRSKNVCGHIGPTKKGPISFARRGKMPCRSSYLESNLPVVEDLVCTGVPCGASEELRGGVVVMDGNERYWGARVGGPRSTEKGAVLTRY